MARPPPLARNLRRGLVRSVHVNPNASFVREEIKALTEILHDTNPATKTNKTKSSTIPTKPKYTWLIRLPEDGVKSDVLLDPNSIDAPSDSRPYTTPKYMDIFTEHHLDYTNKVHRAAARAIVQNKRPAHINSLSKNKVTSTRTFMGWMAAMLR